MTLSLKFVVKNSFFLPTTSGSPSVSKIPSVGTSRRWVKTQKISFDEKSKT